MDLAALITPHPTADQSDACSSGASLSAEDGAESVVGMTDERKPPDQIAARLRRVGEALKQAGVLPPKSDPRVPLTSDDLKLLESKAGVTGLSTDDVRRLLANNARLRRLLIEAANLLAPNSPSDNRTRELYDAIKDEAKR